MSKKTLLAFSLVALLAFMAMPALAADKNVVLKLGGIQPIDDVSTQQMNWMAGEAAKRSNGTIKIEVYPASQLGDAVSQIESLSLGSQDMFVDAQSWLAQHVPDKQVESMFFIFNNDKHFRNYLTSDVGKSMEEQFLKKTGVKVLSNNWVRTPRTYAANRPTRTVDDLVGLKIRAPEIKGYIMSHRALESSPTQVPWGEMYLALSQKVVDACEGPTDSLWSSKIQEVCKYWLMTEHIRDSIVVLINDGKLKSMSPAQQQILLETANEAGDIYSKLVLEKLDRVLVQLKEVGVEVIPLPDKTPFANKVAKAAETLEADGAWKKGLFMEIRNLDK